MLGGTPEETDQLIGQALSRGDVDAAVQLFEPGGLLVDPDSGTLLRGHDEIRRALAAMLEAQPELVATARPRVLVCGDIALVLADWALNMRGTDGSSITETGTATDVMRRQADGTWRYVIDNPGGTSLRL